MSETLEETRARIRAHVSGPGKTSRWITKHLDYTDEDWCLIYPFSWEEGAYPKYRNSTGGKNWVLHRLMCEYRHGAPPSPQHHSAHSCNRGVEGCVNQMHVSWKTASENQFDRGLSEGPRQRTKLTVEEVDQIRALKDRARPIDIAKQFNVSLRNVRFILSGQAWQSEAFRGRRIFTADEVRAIRMTPWEEMTSTQWAAKFGVPRSRIVRIRTGASYKDHDTTRAPYIPLSPKSSAS